ncbi:DUF4167 domain-containing protein [Microvirga guangxiensis]|uniref:DUF4167 domain-containing protein n=1 Tax=Microvirga guangxiensis TaxID=549386 RepID=A0A1G5EKW7_9HYPH|nr:DUF4167 domain-containing protein [Microvirga guangxiensis]SCY27592.1 protein of unknown function [Microvirga guangxiensis]
MRGRNRNNGGNKGPNPLTKSYESNGPDVKIRGTAQHIAEKYSQLARDAQASGDPVAAENYFQHAEHYYRIIAAAQEQLREQYGYQQRFDDEGDEEGFAQDRPNFERSGGNGDEADFGSQPQPYETRGEGDRPARFDRGDRPDRGERQDRGDRQERGDRRERFQRDRGPRQDRQDFQRDDQAGNGEGERPARFERQERQDRPERRERFQRDRRPREEADNADAGGLPAFLTNPVRSAPAPVEEQPVAPTLDFGTEAAEKRPRRTRRPRREVVENAGDEGGSFTPDVETPAAE